MIQNTIMSNVKYIHLSLKITLDCTKYSSLGQIIQHNVNIFQWSQLVTKFNQTFLDVIWLLNDSKLVIILIRNLLLSSFIILEYPLYKFLHKIRTSKKDILE